MHHQHLNLVVVPLQALPAKIPVSRLAFRVGSAMLQELPEEIPSIGCSRWQVLLLALPLAQQLRWLKMLQVAKLPPPWLV